MASLCRCLLLMSDEFENNVVNDVEQVGHHISFLLSLLMCMCYSCTVTCTCMCIQGLSESQGRGEIHVHICTWVYSALIFDFW